MIPIFKIRCSAIGQIMGLVGRPTEIQLADLAELEKKKADKGLTDKQQATLDSLIAKRDAPPQLSDGAKTYCQMWLKEQLYGRKKEFSNKYTEKGIQCEESAINVVAEHMGYGFILKNTEQLEDEYMTGMPDLVLAEIIEEIKNSWSCFTFPLFATTIPDSDYPYQAQGYMHLAKKKKAGINYCLIDAPLEIMDAEARKVWYKAGNTGDVDMECYDEVYAKMTYPDLPMSLRIKRFEFDYDAAIIKAVQDRVKLCREYIASITPKEFANTNSIAA